MSQTDPHNSGKYRSSMSKSDWTGLEEQRVAVREAARLIIKTDAEADDWCAAHGLKYEDLLTKAYRDLDSVKQYPVVVEGAKAQRGLANLVRRLMDEYSLDFWLVSAEYAPILDLTQDELLVCWAAMLRQRVLA